MMCKESVPRVWWIAGVVLLSVAVVSIILSTIIPALTGPTITPASAAHVLAHVPLIDGHNDLPNNLRELIHNNLSAVNLTTNLSQDSTWSCPACQTDLKRMRAGKVGAQFWVAYVPCSTQYKDAVLQTLEQIDVIHRLIAAYPRHLQFAGSVREVWSAHKAGHIASLIGVEGGHSIDSRLAVLRQMYALGVRYLTLTHVCNTPWADSSTVDGNASLSRHNGLTEFGQKVVREMNRLGMMVDLSHVSQKTMRDALRVSTAPVIFSHSSSWELCPNPRNVRDDVLKLVSANDGIVMVNFYSGFVVCDDKRNATLEDAVAHINHIRAVAGVEHVGLGADYDGVSSFPVGLEDVSKYPALLKRLAEGKGDEPRWSEDDLEKLVGLNLLRVMAAVEKVRDRMASERVDPLQDDLTVDLGDDTSCKT